MMQKTECVVSYLTYAVTVCKAEDALNLIKRHVFLNLHYISVELGGCTVGM